MSPQTEQSDAQRPNRLSESGGDVAGDGPNGVKHDIKKGEVVTPRWAYMLVVLFLFITIWGRPDPLHVTHGDDLTIRHVFFYGWLTCVSTGVGAIPFFFLPQVPNFWVGIANAVAAGMMVAASYTLIAEGATYDDPHDTSTITPEFRTAIGTLLGLIFILVTKQFIDQYEDLTMAGLEGADARKALLVFFVMTLHSFSEGVGIGVSFGGVHGNDLGMFISASLAVHNVPEGLAVAVVLLPRGLSVLTACVWAICTSLPQPIMAIPAYLFVHSAIPILPVGLGFAGGAMAWVAFFELLVEAIEETSVFTACLVSTPALIGMLTIQTLLEDMSAIQTE